MSKKKRNSLVAFAIPGFIVLALLVANQFQGLADNPEPPPTTADPYVVEMTCSSLILDGIDFECNGSLSYDGGVEKISDLVYHATIDDFTAEGYGDGSFILDEDHESYVKLTSQDPDGDPFFPADATVYIHIKFDDADGNSWVAEEPTEWVLQHDATEFPVTSTWDTELDQAVTFERAETAEEFTLQSSSATGTP